MSAEYQRLGLTLAALLLMALGAFAASYTVARADGGEAALVVDQDGHVDTYCVGFSGDSISASDLLTKAGYPVVQFNGLVCAVGNENGCFMPSSQQTCVCHSYPPENKYWSFFVKRHGKAWQYAPFGLNDSRAALRDGDMEAWKWGVAGPNSAPAPDSGITFESVCGHAPRGGTEPATASQPTATTPALATVAALTPTQAAAAPPTVAPLTATNAPAATTTGAATLTGENTPLIRNHGTATAVVQAPATGGASGGGSTGQLYAFIAIAGSLLATIVAALIWGRRRGA